MRIGIYIEAVKVSAKTGISRYIIGLVEALTQLDKSNQYYLYYQTEHFLGKDLDWLKDRDNVHFKPLLFPRNWIGDHPSLWWKYYLPFHLWKDRIDVFHGPNHYIPLAGTTPCVLTIHDLAYYYMEVHGSGMDRILKNWTDQSMQRADVVVAISQSTASDCIKEHVNPDKVKVVYQGFEGKQKALTQNKQTMSFSADHQQPYVLFVGTIQPRKNVLYILDGFAKVAQQIPHNLILAGAPGESSQAVQQKIEELGLQKRVLLLGYISDEQRHNLYQHADIFVYPSKYEGFGLVLLEAMSYGIPVITANNSSMPETAGNAAVLVDENNSESLAEAILAIHNDPLYRKQLIEKGNKRIEHFTWESCAQEMLNIYFQAARFKNKG